MRWYVAVGLRSFVKVIGAVAGLIIAALGLFGVLIALGGTGGLTADPPPDHPKILSAIICALITLALIACLYWLSRVLVRAVDETEAR